MRQTISNGSTIRSGRDLFFISALLLFLELAFIRWFPAHVLFLTFFTNTVLLACFLGMSLGCLTASHRRNYLSWTPLLLVVSLAIGVSMEGLRATLEKVVNVGNQVSPQMVFFGTEYRVGDLARFAIPIEAVAALFFLLIALVMIGPGQVLGRYITTFQNPLKGYLINIGGSLAGVLAFALCSWRFGPACWFSIVALGLAYFLVLQGDRYRGAFLVVCALAPVVVMAPSAFHIGQITKLFPETYWSPYYRINYSPPPDRTIVVNLIGHQRMSARTEPYPAYALPYLINRDAGGKPFRDILIIGAGSGNDVSRALEWGPPDVRIDAVEIDPIINALGRRDHPDHPYQDTRVRVHLDDGRNFLRSGKSQYDLIVFALVDSLVLHTSFSNIRLESYLFTEQAFADVRRRLKPSGAFVMYNYFRQWWIVSRLTATLGEVFGASPLVLTMPYQAAVRPEEKADAFTLFFAGSGNRPVAQAFARYHEYFVPNGSTPSPALQNGFENRPAGVAMKFGLTTVELPPDLKPATDDWPFLYLRNPMIPDLALRGMLWLGAISLAMILFFLRSVGGDGAWQFEGRMFFLGAGFMLIETKAVVQMALLFGSTWVVNTVVFAAVLVMMLAANVLVLKRPNVPLAICYGALFLTLALNAAVSLDIFLGWSRPAQTVTAALLVFSPILFASLIFGISFQGVEKPNRALGYNVAGALLGGLAEYCSMVVGFRYLVALAAVFYLLSVWRSNRAAKQAL